MPTSIHRSLCLWAGGWAVNPSPSIPCSGCPSCWARWHCWPGSKPATPAMPRNSRRYRRSPVSVARTDTSWPPCPCVRGKDVVLQLSFGLARAGGPRKYGEMQVPPENEAQLAVEIDRRTIRIEHVQERSLRARRDGSREGAYELGREPLPSAGRMDAHGADFGEAIEPHTLSCHRD